MNKQAQVHTIKTLFSSDPERDMTRKTKTAQARNSGPASFISKVLMLETIASISWISDKENADTPSLNSKKAFLSEQLDKS